LAEREWTAQRARVFPVGRGGPSLLDVVTERLAAREATGDTAWDAWRRQDGTWTLELSFSAGGRTRQAHWVADLDNRSVSPVDDEARWISDEDAPPEPARGRARLQAVKSSVYDLEADGSLEGSPVPSDRARTWPPRRPVPQQHPSVIDDEDLDALNARRGLRSVPRPEDSATAESGPGERGGEDIAPHGQAAGADAAEDAQTLDDPDREAALEHSAGSDDEAGDVVEDLEPAGLDEAPDTPGSGSGSPEEPVADGGADAS